MLVPQNISILKETGKFSRKYVAQKYIESVLKNIDFLKHDFVRDIDENNLIIGGVSICNIILFFRIVLIYIQPLKTPVKQ